MPSRPCGWNCKYKAFQNFFYQRVMDMMYFLESTDARKFEFICFYVVNGFEMVVYVFPRKWTFWASPPALPTRPASRRTTSSPGTVWPWRNVSACCSPSSRDPSCKPRLTTERGPILLPQAGDREGPSEATGGHHDKGHCWLWPQKMYLLEVSHKIFPRLLTNL